MLLRTRRDVHGLDTGLDTRELARTSRMVSRLTGYAVQPNKAIVGRNAFAHESGIHQDGVLKERTTYEIMDATDGRAGVELDRARASTPAATRCATRSSELGFKVEGQALNTAFKRFKEIADKKKQVTALDLEAIVSDEMRERAESYTLAWFEVEAGPRASRARPRRRDAALGRRGGGRVHRRRPGRRDLRRDPARRPRPSASCASTRSRRSPGARTRSAR